MSSERQWRCKACGSTWVADFQQIVCIDCGDDAVNLNEQERLVRKPAQNICLGDLMLGGFLTPERIQKGQ